MHQRNVAAGDGMRCARGGDGFRDEDDVTFSDPLKDLGAGCPAGSLRVSRLSQRANRGDVAQRDLHCGEPPPDREIGLRVEKIDRYCARRIVNLQSAACQSFVQIPGAADGNTG